MESKIMDKVFCIIFIVIIIILSIKEGKLDKGLIYVCVYD